MSAMSPPSPHGKRASPPSPESPPSLPPTPSAVPTPPPPSFLMSNVLPTASTRAIVSANRALSSDRPQAALTLYTQVLNEFEPGHPVAFLNRSLCYLILGLPHLAVMDAYRALFCGQRVDQTRSDDPWGRPLLNLAIFEDECDKQMQTWLAKPTCYAGSGIYDFLDLPLASIAVEPRIRTEPKQCGDRVDWATVIHMTNEVILKAYYRIAVGLWKCGGGALKSAFDVICDAENLKICMPQDRKQFQKLQNMILEKMEKAFIEEAEIKSWLKQTGAIKSDPVTLAEYDECGIRALFASGSTKVPKELYQWDTHSLTWSNHEKVLKQLNEDIKRKTKDYCKLEIKNDTSKAPQLALSAQCDIPCEQSVFQEGGIAHAVIPSSNHRGSHNCDFCGSLLHVSKDVCHKAMRESKELNRQLERADDPKGLVYTGNDAYYPLKQEEHHYYPMSPGSFVNPRSDEDQLGNIPGMSSPEPIPGFQICPLCRRTCYCSNLCHAESITLYHTIVCNRWVDDIPDCYDIPKSWSGLATADAHILLNHLFFRFLASCLKTITHPLDDFNIRILHGDLDNPRRLAKDYERTKPRSIVFWREDPAISDLFPERRTLQDLKRGDTSQKSDTANMMPWSYRTNVVQVVEALWQLGAYNASGALNVALDTRRFDGWMLETMRMKVAFGMRMSSFPRYAMTFDDEGQCVAEAGVIPYSVVAPFVDMVSDGLDSGTSTQSEDMETETEMEEKKEKRKKARMAFIHPLSTLLYPANRESGEYPNVKVYERQGALFARAVESEPGLDSEDAEEEGPAVKKGERLLRGNYIVPWMKQSDDPEKAFQTPESFTSLSDVDSSEGESEEVIIVSETESGMYQGVTGVKISLDRVNINEQTNEEWEQDLVGRMESSSM